MRFARMLPERWQKFLHEVLKFGAVGGVNTVINYAVFNALALTVFVDGQLKANVAATVIATCTSYLMNRHWTYRDRPKSTMRREYALFFLFNATGLAIELGVLALAKYGLGITGLLALNVAKTAGVGLATVFRFWSYRTFVFQKSRAVVPAEADAHAEAGVPAETGAPAETAAPARPGTAAVAGAERPDADVLAELDPVAELAEAASELTESRAADKAAANTSENGARGRAEGDPAETLEIEFATTIDVELETELAAELNAANRRSPTR